MTDRISGFTVTLKPNMREDDAEIIKNCIELLKGVISVEEHVSNPEHYFAYQQASYELREKLWKALEVSK